VNSGAAFNFGSLANTISVAHGGANADFGIAREAWIEYEAAPALAFRMGLIKTAATRQLMTSPEMQQFVDISLASSFIGTTMPGYTDRNRDYGVMVHGSIGCDGEWSYLATVTNGDGPVRRNILDQNTNDNFAYSGRINWDIMGHMGYEEGALKQHECEWVASLGAWAYDYVDVLRDKPHTHYADRLDYGVDGAAGYGSWSFTGAYSHVTFDKSDVGVDIKGYSWLAQLGFLVPDTAWELAARYDRYSFDSGGSTFGATEWGGVVNYYVDGHSDKVSLDFSYITSDNNGNRQADVYAGYGVTGSSNAWLLRLQWQLAL
jgi:hypothetical protein